MTMTSAISSGSLDSLQEDTPSRPPRSFRRGLKSFMSGNSERKLNTEGSGGRGRRIKSMNLLSSNNNAIAEEGETSEKQVSSTRSPDKGSLLQRFLQSTSRRKSQNAASGEGSTVSRSSDESAEAESPVRRATMDVEIPTSTTSLRSTPGKQLRKFSGGFLGNRRQTMDTCSTRKQRSSSEDKPIEEMEEDDYKSIQEKMQRRADDLHKGGQVEKAIDVWLECLELAEKRQDTLASKTELMCILVEMHFEASIQYKHKQQLGYEDSTPASQEDTERMTAFHQKAAKRFVHRIKPVIVKPQWLKCSKALVLFLCEVEAWELASLVADQLTELQEEVEPAQLATLHFQVASIKLESQRQGEAMLHLQATVKNLQQVPEATRDMEMYLQVLQLLANEYMSQSQYGVALEAYEEQLKYAPKEKIASLYCQKATVYIERQELNVAIEQLELAADHLKEAEPTIRLQLLQTKGDLYCRVGRMQDALEVYVLVLQEIKNPADKAKLLYTMGKICTRLKHIRPAISYFTQEMEITQAELGHNHLSVSRVLHELAKLYDDYLGEHKLALMKLNKALHVELACLQECHYSITQCNRCNSVTHQMCSMHATRQRDISAQIRETKKAQGRLHFKLGDFNTALKTSNLEL